MEGKLSDRGDQEYFIWVVPAPFCAMRRNNDPQCVEADRKGLAAEGIRARKANVQYRASRTVSRGECRKHVPRVDAILKHHGWRRVLCGLRRKIRVPESKQYTLF